MAHVVPHRPVLGHLAVSDPELVDLIHGEAPSGWWMAHELAVVRAARLARIATMSPSAMMSSMSKRESGKAASSHLWMCRALDAAPVLGHRRVVEIIPLHEIVNSAMIMRVPDLFDHPPDDDLVLFRHHISSFPRCGSSVHSVRGPAYPQMYYFTQPT